MRQYYIHNGQIEIGPFDIENLKQQTLKKDTPVWYEGIEGWTTANEIEELKPLFIKQSKPPPLTKATPTPIVETKKVEQTPTYNAMFPKKKTSYLIPILIAGLLIVGSVIGWLVYQNSQNRNTIESLNEEVSSTKQTLQTKQNEADNQEAERQRINRANTEKNMNFRNNWQNYIKQSNSEPRVNYTLGGISEFDVFINNETSYLLDQVDVYIQYIRKNGEVYQDKTISIFNVPAGSSETGVAPSSVNGVKVNCSISKIISRKMHFCYPSDNGNQEDPYFCK